MNVQDIKNTGYSKYIPVAKKRLEELMEGE